MLNPLLILFIHLREILHIGEEDLCFDYSVQRGSSFGQDGGEGFEDCGGLFGYGTRQERSIWGGGELA